MQRKPYPKPTQERLREYFDYDAVSGWLLWKKPKGPRTVGDPAGVRTDRYIMIRIDGVLHKLRDLVWIWHYGDLPLGGVKQVDGLQFNHRIENLRPKKEVATRIHEFQQSKKQVSFF